MRPAIPEPLTNAAGICGTPPGEHPSPCRPVLPALRRRLLALPPDAEALPAAHAGGNRVMLMQYSVRGPGDFFTLPQPYAACTALSYSPEDLSRLPA